MTIHTLEETLTGRRGAVRQFEGLREAVVERVDGDGRLWVRLMDQPRVEYGPVRWQRPVTGYTVSESTGGEGTHTHSVSVEAVYEDPPRGTRCLISFVGSGADRPWLVTFGGWPA